MNSKASRLLTLAAFTLSFVNVLEGDTPSTKLAPVLQPFVESHTLAGAVVLVADPDKVLDIEAVGWADIAGKKPMRPDCLFWVASQSKPITATALMILVDEGKVNVDDPVEKYLPEFKGQQVNVSSNATKPELKAPRHPILVREVLSHTSGLPFKSDMEQPTLDLFPLAARVKSYAKMELLFEPGMKSQYSNAGINTAGRIVEVVSGMSFEKFLDERIFKPLGMTDTSFFPSKSQLERLAKAYKPNAAKDDLEECEITQLKYPLDDCQRQSMPAGGLFSTANDLSIFYRMIANKGIFNGTRILSEKSVQQMTSDQSGKAKSSYGFGFGTNGRIVTHGGAYNSMSRFDHEHQLITIFLGQHAGWIKDGKTIIPVFQKNATDVFGSKVKSKPNGVDALPDVGNPAQNPTKPVAAMDIKHVVITNSIGMKFAAIAAGSFQMGQDGPQADYQMMKHPEKFDDADWDERPVHRVRISKSFLMGVTEVSNAQYEQFDPEHAKTRMASAWSRTEDEAVVNVSWEDAVKFCEWLSAKEKKTYRLPTEAEWEYACRAGTTTLFNLGDSLPDGFTKWLQYQTKCLGFFQKPFSKEYRAPSGKEPLRVGQTPPNAWGLYDMHGNVEEWCADWYGPYESGEQTNPIGRSIGDFRVTRGGSHSQWVRMMRSANRSARIPTQRSVWNGFRVVQADAPTTAPLPPAPLPLCRRDVSQQVASLKPLDEDKPIFQGPRKFVKIPPGSLGPLFSKHNHSPAIAECPNGDLLAVWFSCVEEQGSEMCVAASRLRFGATEWEDASSLYDVPDVNDHYPKLWFDGDKTLYLFVAGLVHNNFLTSQDNGATWSKPQPIYPLGEVGNAAFRTKEGFIVQPHDSPSSFIISRDEGKTWTFQNVSKNSAGVWTNGERDKEGKPIYDAFAEPGNCWPGKSGIAAAGIHIAMAQLGDGSLMGIGRYDKPELQARFHGRAPISITKDWGKTWTYRESEFSVISSAQRAALIRLREGPLMYCSFTEKWSDWKNRKGMTFKAADGSDYTGYGLFAALSFDDGQTWPVRRLITDGGTERTLESTDGNTFKLSATLAEPFGYLFAIQTRDGRIQLISSRNHYVFNLAWLKSLPPAPPALATADPHLDIGKPGDIDAKTKVIPTVQPASKVNVTIFNEPGRYGGWPANHGLWQWGDEIVSGFEVAWYKHPINDHAVDRSKPFENWQARSLDGGKTWKMEHDLPFTPLGHEKTPVPPTESLDFTAPDFALMFRFGGLHEGPSWFYTSNDRCKTWQGPFSFKVPGIDKICTRTDLVVLGKHDCLMFGSMAKSDGKEGRVFCARTTDGGLNWRLVSLIGPEPKEGYSIMPSTLRLTSGALITTIRHGGGQKHSITTWRSDDLGQHWTPLGEATPNIGSNPPALVQLRDGRLCLSYGYRKKPFGVRARISNDEGRTWGPEIILRDDGLTGDLGYPRSIVRPDGKVFTVYYFNGPRDEDRMIQGTLFTP